MLVSKVLIWSIYFCYLIQFSFSSSKFTKENELLFRNYSQNLHERCHKNSSHNVPFTKEGAAIENKEFTAWNSANGSTQAKNFKMLLSASSFSKRVYSLTEENENTMFNSVRPSPRLFASTRNIVEEKDNFFVVTAIFNPASFKSRYNLYHKFAKHMNETGAQLITIECIFPFLNQTKFEVTEPNNPWHIQLKSESVYWMKENLINIAVSRLPQHAKWVSWLDADIEFEEKHWVDLTIKELKNYTVVQIFEKAKFLGPSPKKEILRVDYSFGYMVKHNMSFDIWSFGTWYPHPGYGWAMSVNDFREIKGLPDHNIVGSGDRFFAFAIANRISGSFTINETKLHPDFLNLNSDVGNKTFTILHEISKSTYKEIVGYVPVTIRHHWHGSTMNRQYNVQWKIYKDNNFDFKNDISVNEDGLFQLTQSKPKFQTDLLTYFQIRHEDETVTYVQEDSKMCKARLFYEGERQKREKLSNRLRKKPIYLIARMLRYLGLGWILGF